MRCIDGDAMIKRLEEWNTDDPTDRAMYNFTMHRINEQPTIEPDWTELMIICDNCGHAIHVNRTDAKPTIEPDLIAIIQNGIKATDADNAYSCGMRVALRGEPGPCEDAVNKIKNASFTGSDGLDYVETLVALDALKLVNSSSAQPERENGHKIIQHSYPAKWLCSECGAKHFDFDDRFCSKCGAKMEEGEE